MPESRVDEPFEIRDDESFEIGVDQSAESRKTRASSSFRLDAICSTTDDSSVLDKRCTRKCRSHIVRISQV